MIVIFNVMIDLYRMLTTSYVDLKIRLNGAYWHLIQVRILYLNQVHPTKFQYTLSLKKDSSF